MLTLAAPRCIGNEIPITCIYCDTVGRGGCEYIPEQCLSSYEI